MSKKSIGINAERELIHMFNKNNWVAFRAAGSGSTKYPCPDIIAGNNLRKLAIEVKKTTKEYQYLTKKEVNELKFFSQKFGAEPWIAIKFTRKEWCFVSPENLTETEKHYTIKKKNCDYKGITFKEIIKK